MRVCGRGLDAWSARTRVWRLCALGRTQAQKESSFYSFSVLFGCVVCVQEFMPTWFKNINSDISEGILTLVIN